MTDLERSELKNDLLILVRRVCRQENGIAEICPEEVKVLPDIVAILLSSF